MPDYQALTSALDFSKNNVVVVGGTQGIGAGIARRFAELGASVLVVGRNEKLGNDVVQSLKEKGAKDAKHGFVKKDLGSVKGIKEAAEEIALWAGDEGVQYLFQSQGGLACFMPPTVETLSTGFNVQILSHFLIPYILLTRPSPALRTGARICNIGRPGERGRQIDFDDFVGLKAAEAGKFGSAGGMKWVFMIDLLTHEFNLKFPSIHTTHIYPGQVFTNGVSAPTLPWYIRLLGPIVLFLLGISPEKYANVAIWQNASEDAKKLDRAFWDQYSKEVNVDERVKSDEELRARVWDGLMRLGEVA